jgi:hypothetical protein
MATAALAAQPDIGAKPVHEPSVCATRVGAAKAHNIAQKEFKHGKRTHQSRGLPRVGASERCVALIWTRS